MCCPLGTDTSVPSRGPLDGSYDFCWKSKVMCIGRVLMISFLVPAIVTALNQTSFALLEYSRILVNNIVKGISVVPFSCYREMIQSSICQTVTCM